uniref:Uncharacterized protein n=1 Tax=Setaria viridis TaxID=4556 RepID=A0A4U6U9R8_SETVI|nr:hypothetical protein SEVIR_6G177800v2 [Setaria viridis]
MPPRSFWKVPEAACGACAAWRRGWFGCVERRRGASFLWRGLPSPNDHPAGDLDTARSAIFIGVVNGVASTSYLQLCLLSGGGGTGARSYCLYQFSSYLTAMLGVVLVAGDMAFPATTVIVGSPEWEPVVKWMVWIVRS